MKGYNLNDNQNQTSDVDNIKATLTDVETAVVSKLPEPIAEKVTSATIPQKITSVLLIITCVLTVMLAFKIFGHASAMANYEIPDDAVVQEEVVSAEDDTETEDDTIYVDEVVYNPSTAAGLLTERENSNGIWVSLQCNYTWTFKSGYDYRAARVDCLWVCTNDDTGEVLAYHTGIYNGGTESFENEETILTLKGAQYLGAN